MNRDLLLSRTERILNKKYFIFIYFAVCFAVPFILYGSLFSADRIFISGDGIAFYSVRIFFANALKNGEFTLWNPYLSNGVPFAEDMNGIFYPVQVLLSFLPGKLFVYSYYAFQIALGSTFMYLYLDEIGCGKIASLCTGLLYLMSIQISGLRKSHMTIITCVVFLPVILYFVERYIKTRKTNFLIISALFMALQFMAGHTQNALYSDLAVGVYLLVMQFRNKFPIKRIIKDVLIWGGLYAGLICVQLLPILNIMKEYQKSGAADTSYATFCGWSIHPVKLVMMLFPQIFGQGNIYQPLGSAYSSELDIEIFMGVGVFIMILYAAVVFFKDFRVRLSLSLMFVTFLYCAQAHIPLLSKLLYKIPVISGFRVSSRALFIFTFFGFVLFAISLSKLRDKVNFAKLHRFINRFAIVSGSVIGLTLFVLSVNTIISGGDFSAIISYFNTAFAKMVYVVLLAVICVNLMKFALERKGRFSYRSAYAAIAAVLFVVTLYETMPYSTQSETIDSKSLTAENSIIQEQMLEDIGDSKVLLAWNSFSGGFISMLMDNSNTVAELPAINCYSTFNNPRLFRLFTDKSIMSPAYNYSGMLNGFPDAKNNLYFQNDLLSMLGVKYIIDPLGYIDAEGSTAEIVGEDKEVLAIPKLSIAGQSSADIQVWLYEPLPVEKNTFYKISMDIDASSDKSTSLRVDFCGGVNYDLGAQDKAITADSKPQSTSIIFNSGDTSLAGENEIVLRIYGTSEADVEITNIKVTKMKAEYQANVYKYYGNDGASPIYENTNVLGILYSPAYLKSINSTEDIYDNVLNYSLDDTSYIENYTERDISLIKTTIDILSHTNNAISANVSSDGDTFVNFSQNYFPGWKAYVDGVETKIYIVNGLIQGIEVPGGDHEITFRYFPAILLISACISACTLAAAFILIILEHKKEKHNG